jgi:hypothetical protein
MIRAAVCLSALLLGAPSSVYAEPRFGPWPEDLQERVRAISDGELRFLAEPPDKPVHHHHNRIILTPSSLEDGWVTLEQCHSDLDPVPRAQIVYHPERTKDLRVVSYEGIARAEVQGPSVQLRDVGPGAGLCVQARTLTLLAAEDGGFELRNGPFMRRFLDGYYPMRVSMDIELPSDALRFVDARPGPQAGLSLREAPGRIELDAWFEGELRTTLRFAHQFCDNPDTQTC